MPTELKMKQSRLILHPDICYQTIMLPCSGIKAAFVPKTVSLMSRYEEIVSEIPDYYRNHIAHLCDKNYRLQSALCFLLLQELAGHQVTVLFTENGKPYDAMEKVFFSFSHTDEYAVCAAAGIPVGVDASSILPYDQSIAQIICSETETVNLENAGEQERDMLLTEYFTKKESRIKRNGGVLSMVRDKEMNNLNFYTMNLDSKTVCSVCYETRN